MGWIFRFRICEQFAQYRLSAEGLLRPENLACDIHIGKIAKLENNLGNLSGLVESKKKKKKKKMQMLCAGKGLASNSSVLSIPINQGQLSNGKPLDARIHQMDITEIQLGHNSGGN